MFRFRSDVPRVPLNAEETDMKASSTVDKRYESDDLSGR